MAADDTLLSPLGPASSRPAPAKVYNWRSELVRDGDRRIAVEMPVQISFGTIRFAVMMLTPGDLEDFAYGFSLTEGMVQSAAEIRAVTLVDAPEGLTVQIDLIPGKLQQHLARQRAMTGRTGCGVCGIDDLNALKRADRMVGAAPPVSIARIETALAELEAKQVLNAATGAVHAAAWASPAGNLLHVREDVGRHNALDKLIGAAMRDEIDPLSGFVIITSRCSFEMVEKAASFGARTLVAISAPTSLAIERAEALDVALIGLARRDTLSVFTGARRLL